MHKTDKITFNVNDLQRKHTCQKRCYDNIGLARLINSPTIQERVKKGDLTFSYQYETKTLVYKGSNTWKVVG